MEIKTGGRNNGNRIHNALTLLHYMDELEPHKLYGIVKFGSGTTILTKYEVVSKKEIEKEIKKLEEDGYWNFLESRDLDITIRILKGLIEDRK